MTYVEPDYRFVTGDTLPTIEEALALPDGYNDFSGATVRFHMRDDSRNTVVDASATFDDTDTGDVSYELTSTDTEAPGHYRAEFEVTFSDGRVKTHPAEATLSIVVRQGLDG